MTTLSKLLKSTIFRLTLLYAAMFVGAAMIVIAYISWTSTKLLENRITETLLAETLGLAEQYRARGVKELARVINKRIRSPGNAIYLVTDNKGGWIAGNVKSLTRGLWNKQGRVEFAYQRKGPKGVEMRHAVARIYRLAKGFRLMVGRDVEDQRRFAKLIRNSVLSGLAFMLIVGLGGGWLVTQSLLKRIDAVTTTSRVIMAGDLGGRVPVRGTGDELDRLAVNLNAMLERIEQLMNGLREVSDNIAHDLKTPLNRMRNRVEAALRSEKEGEYREVLEKTIEESDQLIRTFNALLSIAKLEAGTGSSDFSEYELAEIVHDVVELYEPLAEEQGLSIEFVLDAPARAKVDRQLIGQAISNLLDNAIKYGNSETGEEAGKVELRVGEAKSGEIWNEGWERAVEPICFVSVADNGPGIPEEDYDRALKRFGRLEDSRSKPGTGLGLSLVSAVAKMHGGKLRLEDNKPGLRSWFVIPCRCESKATKPTILT